MPRCEICRGEQTRRKRFNDHLVCDACFYLMRFPQNAAYQVHQLNEEIEKYRKTWAIRKPQTKHRFNSPFSAVPPKYVLENAMNGLKVASNYRDGFGAAICDYYGVDSPGFQVKPEIVPDKAVACYVRQQNMVYSKGTTMAHHTAFHEIWHALESFGIVPYNPKTSEQDAGRYADACLSRLYAGERIDR